MDERAEVKPLHRDARLVLETRIERQYCRVMLRSVKHHRSRVDARAWAFSRACANSEYLRHLKNTECEKWIAKDRGEQRGIGGGRKQNPEGSEAGR
jgi:hypothetical protein